MIVSQLHLTDFRNYAEETFRYREGVNIVCGGNAQGKTNSAEAIFFLCTGYSPRAKRDKQVIRHGQTSARVSCEAQTRYGSVSAEIRFFSDRNKEVSVNGVPVSRIGELLGNVNSVFFNPGELRLVQESPEDRRRFLDISLSQLSRGYFYALQKYKKILAQRNNLLKEENLSLIRETLPVWDAQLAAAGAKIVAERNAYVRMLSPFAGEAHGEITGGRETLTVTGDYRYEGTEEEICRQLADALREKADKDIELGYTTVGPHRDDLKIRVNDSDVRTYGSQGQQRTAAISLKLAETEIFRERFGEYPVLILDDAMSELDCSRKRRLQSFIGKMQTIVTVTEKEDVPGYEKANIIRVEDGKIVSD
ncbi:MAG: DNA replication/repair protein RecF [Candidatus Borkfalkiaceae bacterium]|nr:DNA replication/repair protein RecF [Christensenellaceae bacterium]